MPAVRPSVRGRWRAGLRWRGHRDDSGYIAVATAIITPVLLGLAAFTVDVGNWYAQADNIQRAADAASLAGVTYLPGNLAAAEAQAVKTAAANGYTNGVDSVVVDPEPVSGNPNQLRVTITQTISNSFGQLLGKPTETITRTAVANYQAPLPLGSPCNEFGNGPDPTIGAINQRSSNCSSAGSFWGNVGSPLATKSYGDAYQDGGCASGIDNCSGTNSDYSTNGYFYSIKLSAPVTNLTIQSFDPAFVSVSDTCGSNFGSGATAAVNAKNDVNYDVTSSTYKEDSQLYAAGASSPYCTGDQLYGSLLASQAPDTTFTIRQPSSSSNPWDPTSYPVVASCTKTFKGYSGDLYTALNEWNQTNGAITQPATPAATYQPAVASEFRQWVTLCTFPGTVSAGTYFVQVQTNASGDNTSGNGHNRFSIRATGSGGGDSSHISISGYTDMAIYANAPSATTTFYLTQVQPGAAGQVLQLRFFDIGDATYSGGQPSITVNPPSDSNVGAFSGCVGAGPATGALTNCSIVPSSAYNGKWETISIPIPATYTCSYLSVTGCWVTLTYQYGAGNQPSDTTSWAASIDGTPVRLTQ